MAPEVRLSGPENEPLGIVSLAEALRMAGELDVDLVEISATANPPVCRLMDYGKFKYLEQKKAAEAKSKQKIIEVKEVKFRPGTDEGDYQIKMRNLRRFIEEDGDKGKVTLRYRGREITHQDIGMRLLERIRDELADVSVVENMPKLEGRQMIMVLTPNGVISRYLYGNTYLPADVAMAVREAASGQVRPTISRMLSLNGRLPSLAMSQEQNALTSFQLTITTGWSGSWGKPGFRHVSCASCFQRRASASQTVPPLPSFPVPFLDDTGKPEQGKSETPRPRSPG